MDMLVSMTTLEVENTRWDGEHQKRTLSCFESGSAKGEIT
jgi:hypothetical protein